MFKQELKIFLESLLLFELRVLQGKILDLLSQSLDVWAFQLGVEGFLFKFFSYKMIEVIETEMIKFLQNLSIRSLIMPCQESHEEIVDFIIVGEFVFLTFNKLMDEIFFFN